MAVTVETFRTSFPEFGSTDKFPDGQVTFWLGIAALLLNPVRFSNMLDYATQLYVAHNLFLERTAQNAAAMGIVPGAQLGILNNKSVGPVSAGYDASLATLEGAGDFNLSTYGTRLQKLIRMFGAGPIQVW